MSDDQELKKELFAWYGGALYAAQCFEAEIATQIILVHRILGNVSSVAEIDALDDSLSKKILGQVFVDLKKVIQLEDGLEEKFQECVKLRNRLSHGYFYLNAEQMMSAAGSRRVIEDLAKAFHQFREADDAAKERSIALRKIAGISEEELQRRMAVERDRLRAKVNDE